MHGAEIYAGQLSNDQAFVEEIEANGMARALFTIEFTQRAIQNSFSTQGAPIFKEFVKMLLLDALVGNNDRHFYNWAVVQHIENKHQPYFSPIYDTARGLFWNYSEQKILSLQPKSQQYNAFINKYYRNSKPKIGIDGSNDINHFDIARFIIENEYGISNEEVNTFFNKNNLETALMLIKEQFEGLLSKERASLIINCLTQRFDQIFKAA